MLGGHFGNQRGGSWSWTRVRTKPGVLGRGSRLHLERIVRLGFFRACVVVAVVVVVMRVGRSSSTNTTTRTSATTLARPTPPSRLSERSLGEVAVGTDGGIGGGETREIGRFEWARVWWREGGDEMRR
ncbi:hypothetical protein M758_10G015300 [Ceratodon purpureus]|nr:hypothetical protein M758_10G015300 [Ceratodon purpureus]